MTPTDVTATGPGGGDISDAMAQIARLTADGLLGFFTHFEVTEVVAFGEKGAPPRNVFSIFVAEDRAGRAATEPAFLCPPITLKGAKNWRFGICRYLTPIADIMNAMVSYGSNRQWRPSGQQLEVGALVAMSPQFVPADTTAIAAWNCVLKNNFWNGSHVIELTDPDKAALRVFFDNPPLLQELSEQIQAHAPIALASLSDRLGNLVFQIPVTVLTATFAHQRSSGDVVVSLGWDPRAVTRKVRAVCDMRFDDILTGYATAELSTDVTTIPTAADLGMLRAELWDEENRILLAAMGSTGFFRTISLNTHVMDPEPRIFEIPRNDGYQSVRVALQTTNELLVEAPNKNTNDEWASKRIYRKELSELSRERKFVQYRPTGTKAAAREAGLEDLRYLLRRYGKDGAWLWDPYLTSSDILDTLFYCNHSGVELRALTGAENIPGDDVQMPDGLTRHQAFAARQRETFDRARSNWRGIRLEYRMRCGSAGWAFHDRFLIFPVNGGGAHAWSLGTSVNSFGTIHHILQKVDDGQLIMDAFSELWAQLDQPQHLILKRP